MKIINKFLVIIIISFYCNISFAQDKGILSFMYHRINENKPALSSTNVKLEMFQQHIQLLEKTKYGFRIVLNDGSRTYNLCATNEEEHSEWCEHKQNIIQNTPTPEDIGDVPSELDSLL